DLCADLLSVRANVLAEYAGRTCRRLVETKKCVNEGCLSGTVRTEKADGTTLERALQVFEDCSLAECDPKFVEFDDWIHWRFHLRARIFDLRGPAISKWMQPRQQPLALLSARDVRCH